MIGVDTNVFLRFFLQETAAQHRAAQRLLADASESNPILVHPIVLLEAEWVLRSIYKLGRAEIVRHLSIALMADRLIVSEPEACEAALSDYEAGRADLAEALVAHLNRAAGCKTTFTFDKPAARLAPLTLLPT